MISPIEKTFEILVSQSILIVLLFFQVKNIFRPIEKIFDYNNYFIQMIRVIIEKIFDL